MSINEKLLKIQTELKAPKSQYNSFGNYNYRSCEDIVEALKPLCEKNNCVLAISDEVIGVNDRVYVKATAELFDNESKEKVSSNAFAREDTTKKGMDGAQITGSSSSYARKYALNGLFCIDDTKDGDTDGLKANEKFAAELDKKETEVNALKVQFNNVYKSSCNKLAKIISLATGISEKEVGKQAKDLSKSEDIAVINEFLYKWLLELNKTPKVDAE